MNPWVEGPGPGMLMLPQACGRGKGERMEMQLHATEARDGHGAERKPPGTGRLGGLQLRCARIRCARTRGEKADPGCTYQQPHHLTTLFVEDELSTDDHAY